MGEWSFARVLSHYPYVVLLVVLVVVSTCLVITLTIGPPLNFDEPLAGFEPRGTVIGKRLVAFENLITNLDGNVNLLPFSHQQDGDDSKDMLAQLQSKYKATKSPKSLRKSKHRDRSRPKRSKSSKWAQPPAANNSHAPALCGVPDIEYSRIVVTSTNHHSLLNHEDIQAMCDFEVIQFRPNQIYKNTCVRNHWDGFCCPAWSLPNYIALLQGKTSCQDITAQDVTEMEELLIQCAPFFKNYSLEANCDNDVDAFYHNPQFYSSSCEGVPTACTKYNAVYNILFFLADTSFASSATDSHISSLSTSHSPITKEPSIQYSTIFLPVVTGSASTDVFHHLDQMSREFSGLKIVAANFGIKYTLFEKYLLLDSVWLAVACGVIFVAMWLYSTSIIVTIMTFLSMFWAVEVAYFIYTFLFKVKFFPYMNMVTLVVMIGIGADDLFIYCKVWHLAKAEKNNGMLDKIVSDTLSHTTLSMVVTSLTTAAAFYASYISDITAIRCFSVYAGTCIMINLILTITWLPASIMLYEKWCRCCVGMSQKDLSIRYYLCKIPFKLYCAMCECARIVCEKVLPCLVIKFRYLWIFILGGLWILSIIVIFYYPRLKLPSSSKFQVFTSDHLLELYDFEYGEMFEFERVKDEDIPTFPITVVWGVLPTDNGDPLDPHSRGSLDLDPNFDITTPKAQRWILDFCTNLRRTDFFMHAPGMQLTECFFENFVYRFMKQPCHKENTECCNQTQFPFHPATLISCLSLYIPSLRNTPSVHYASHSPGPRFHNGRISAFFIQFPSNHSFTQNYEKANTFYMKVNRWVTKEILQAPPEMRRGWFISHLSFYDLQWSLALGTPLALGVSLTVVSIVSFFTTLNVLISIYALMAVGATISVTLASLVLMDWELNILESVVITISIGLAVDLTLHYGVAYRLAPDIGKEMRVITSLSRMGSPVTMATFTSLSAGAFMMPSTVLVYRRFGLFLLLLVSIAWIYATFFFQSLLRTIGPDAGFGQFHWPASDCCTPNSRGHVDKTIYALSESTLSSSSTSTRDTSHNYSYTQELEPLTDRTRQRHFRYPYCQAHENSVNNRFHNDEESDDHQQASHHHHYHHYHHHHHHHHRGRTKGRYVPIRINSKAEIVTELQVHQQTHTYSNVVITQRQSSTTNTNSNNCTLQENVSEDSSSSLQPAGDPYQTITDNGQVHVNSSATENNNQTHNIEIFVHPPPQLPVI